MNSDKTTTTGDKIAAQSGGKPVRKKKKKVKFLLALRIKVIDLQVVM